MITWYVALTWPAICPYPSGTRTTTLDGRYVDGSTCQRCRSYAQCPGSIPAPTWVREKGGER